MKLLGIWGEIQKLGILNDTKMQERYFVKIEQKAKLSDVNLQSADLYDAYLGNAYLVNVELRGANMEGAHIENAIFIGCHLFRAKGVNLSPEQCDRTIGPDGFTQG